MYMTMWQQFLGVIQAENTIRVISNHSHSTTHYKINHYLYKHTHTAIRSNPDVYDNNKDFV